MILDSVSSTILDIKKKDIVTKYLVFRELDQKPKTKVYGVYTRLKYRLESSINEHHLLLGVVYYYARWRQYLFQAYEQPILANSCLTDIHKFVEILNKGMKNKNSNLSFRELVNNLTPKEPVVGV